MLSGFSPMPQSNVLGGSWVAIRGVISEVTILITLVREFVTNHAPPRRVQRIWVVWLGVLSLVFRVSCRTRKHWKLKQNPRIPSITMNARNADRSIPDMAVQSSEDP